MVPWLVDIPQTRTAPEDIRRRLRLLDPTAEVIYLGAARWAVGKVRPTQQSIRIATRMLAQYWRMPAHLRAGLRGVQRYRFAQACQQGFRPVTEYRLWDLDGRVVEEFRVSQFQMNHAPADHDITAEYEAALEADRAKNRAELGDIGRATDSLNYMKQSNFGYAVSSVAKEAPVPSGRTRHTQSA